MRLRWPSQNSQSNWLDFAFRECVFRRAIVIGSFQIRRCALILCAVRRRTDWGAALPRCGQLEPLLNLLPKKCFKNFLHILNKNSGQFNVRRRHIYKKGLPCDDGLYSVVGSPLCGVKSYWSFFQKRVDIFLSTWYRRWASYSISVLRVFCGAISQWQRDKPGADKNQTHLTKKCRMGLVLVCAGADSIAHSSGNAIAKVNLYMNNLLTNEYIFTERPP